MRFVALPIIALLLTAVFGSPTRRSSIGMDDDDGDGVRLASPIFDSGWIVDGQHHDLCGDVTFQNLLPLPYPLPRTPATASDCEVAIASLRSPPGGWFNVTGAGYAGVQGSGYGTLARAGHCALGVYRADGDDALSFGVGDADVADLLGYALVHYRNRTGDVVHVAGEGNCGPVWFGFEIYGAENPDVPTR
ncbi:hypothetical protein F4775DRAFT_604007 [Biscogniauxia sp. FL1348]|nr:hypothetical protein F4775DRAFT_604007 [Biscogniauxia sp. FL1348]